MLIKQQVFGMCLRFIKTVNAIFMSTVKKNNPKSVLFSSRQLKILSILNTMLFLKSLVQL